MNDNENKLRGVYHCPKTDCAKIVIPAPNALKERSLEEILNKAIPDGLSYRVISTEQLPNSRNFRNAWTDLNPTVTVDVNMEKARVIHMDRLRVTRDEKLAALDVDFMRAVEEADSVKMKEIGDKKQSLRDIPQTFLLDGIDDPDLLAKAIPKDLK